MLGPRVTETQRETLRLAYEAGYYEEPRETTLGELATELGVGERAVFRRLRRGTRGLLAATFGDRAAHREDV
ncbi:MAG: helix-turn-helix domain-containing protein [Haloarculaceae archaeon]